MQVDNFGNRHASTFPDERHDRCDEHPHNRRLVGDSPYCKADAVVDTSDQTPDVGLNLPREAVSV